MLLEDREWKEFSFYDVGIKSINSKAYHSNEVIKHYKGIAYITRTGYNNGVTAIVKNQDEYKTNPSNTMSYGAENADFFYHPYKYITGNKMYYLQADSFNKYLWLFIKGTLANCIKDCFSFGYGMIPARLMRKKFLLPINECGTPDYAFMEAYVKEQEKSKKQTYLTYIKNMFTSLEYKEIPTLEEKEWKEFYIKDLFRIQSGKRLIKAHINQGQVPFIGATDSNNGITNWVSNTNSSLDSNLLGVNYNGSIVENFYHPYTCVFSDDVKRFHLKDVVKSKFVYLFFKVILLQQKNKYTYAYKFNSQRMHKQKILVPVDNRKAPDYAYMEQYIKNLMLKKYNAYIEYQRTV